MAQKNIDFNRLMQAETPSSTVFTVFGGVSVFLLLPAGCGVPTAEPASFGPPLPPETSAPLSSPDSSIRLSPAGEEPQAAPPPSEEKAAPPAASQEASESPPAPPPEISPETDPDQNQTRTVYYTRTGKQYHYENPCGNGTYYPCTLAEALGRGLTPCQKCVLH